ncbi:MAG: hypothetical protein A2173_04480 [Planctomycetes bacterium RBG_13_44_8b]|nr:MAG: hypothetical protein A2173_04480 [Planctomycetes bacterium RBG_13_44_8b]
MNSEEKCGECKYFAGKNEGETTGECHRHAPRPSPRPKMQIEGRDLFTDIQWPKVGINTWCGEFEKK